MCQLAHSVVWLKECMIERGMGKIIFKCEIFEKVLNAKIPAPLLIRLFRERNV
jgi:hypothetical protein